MKRPLLTLAALALALPCSTVRAQDVPSSDPAHPDTVRFGDLVRIEAPSLRPQTGRFLEADSAMVHVALARGSAAKIGRADLQRLELSRGRDWGRGFRRGALIGGAIGVGMAALAAVALANCGECEGGDPGEVILLLTGIVVAPPAALGGLLGLASAPRRWRPAVLPPPAPAESVLPVPDLGRVPIWIFAATEAKADSAERAGERLRATETRGLEVSVFVNDTRTGPAEVAYFDRSDAAEAATLAFWLGRVLRQATPESRFVERARAPRHLEVWLGR